MKTRRATLPHHVEPVLLTPSTFVKDVPRATLVVVACPLRLAPLSRSHVLLLVISVLPLVSHLARKD